MSIIIPYEDDMFGKNGSFISLNGKILDVKNDHESFCKEYLKTIHNDEILKLRKAYDKYSKDKALSDFMVLVLEYDKVEALLKNTISTSSRQPHIRLYNYYLMDWTINVYERLHFNPKTNQFDIINPNPLGFDQEDSEAYYEIEEIKAKTPILERKLFLK